MANAQGLLDETNSGTEGLQELSAQAKETKDVLVKGFETMNESTKKLNAGIIQAAVEMKKQGTSIDAYVKQYGNATAAQKAMEKELINLAAQGKQNTKQFEDLRKSAASLKDTILDTRGEIRKMASDTSSFDKIAEGGRAIAAGFSIAAGASAVLGEENEDLQKSIQKAQGAMAVLLGTQELAKIATEKGGIATGIATGIQRVYTLVVGESAGALKVFRLALAATGIGLAIVGIAALVAHWDDLKEAIGGASKEQKLLKDLFKTAAEDVEKERISVGGLVEEYKSVNTSKERRIAIIKQLKEESPAYFGQLKAEKTSVEELTGAYTKYAEALVVKAEVDALAKKIAENNLALNKVAKENIEESLSTTQQLVNGVITFFNPAAGATKALGDAQQNSAEKAKNLKDENEALTESLNSLIKKMNELGGDPHKVFDKIAERVKAQVIDITGIQTNFNSIVDDIIRNQQGTQASKRELILSVGLFLKASPEEVQAALAKLSEEVGADIQKVAAKPIDIDITAKVNILTDEQQANLDSFISVGKSVEGIVNNIASAVTSATDIEVAQNQRLIDSLNKKVQTQESVLGKQEELQKKGLANNVATEKRRLDALHKQQEIALEKQRKLAQQRQAIDAVTQTVSLITASAQIFSSLASAGPVGVAIAGVTIASMFAAFIAAQIKAAEMAEDGFRGGGFTGDGDPSEVSTRLGNRGYKYHKREFVFDEEKTAQHRDFFEALHKDDRLGIIYGISDLLKDTGVSLPDPELPYRLSSTKDEYETLQRESENEELRLMRKKLEDIEANMNEWKNRDKEETISHGNTVITRKGNRTVIKSKNR